MLTDPCSLCTLMFVAALSYGVVHLLVNGPLVAWNRWLRSKNIASQGWPPAHLDADGDFRPEPGDSDAD